MKYVLKAVLCKEFDVPENRFPSDVLTDMLDMPLGFFVDASDIEIAEKKNEVAEK